MLVVDDDPSIRQSLKSGFDREGHATIDAEDGVSAIKILETEKVDLIVSDAMMPELDGFGLCHAIRNKDRIKNIPFILYTGTFFGNGGEELAYKAGADRYVPKPASFEKIYAVANEIAGKRIEKTNTPEVQQQQLLRDYNNLLQQKLRAMREKQPMDVPYGCEESQISEKMEALGKLASGVAHDFNNLLSIVLTYARFIKKNKDASPQIIEDIEEIEKAALKSARLTKQLLAFSRKQPFEPTIFDPASWIVEMENLLKPLIGEKIRVTTTISGEIGKVKVDANQLEQIILNLALNARDAMPDGGTISLGVSNAHKGDSDLVMISVEDNGCGMSPETLARVFEPFFTTKPRNQGTGLGLSIVERLVQQNGGSITADSELDKGSMFRIFLPRLNEKGKP